MRRSSPAASSHEPRPPSSHDAPFDHYRLLVVDDNPSIHDDFRRIFGPEPESSSLDELAASVFGISGQGPRATYTLDHASQGQQALERVVAAREAGRPYALVFMDVRMPPGWDGVETCARVMEFDSDVHVVLCTAYLERSWKDRVEALPGRDRVLVLKKPFDVLEIQQLASALCERWTFARRDRARMRDLERSVTEQRGRLADAATHLRNEIASRTLAERRLDKARRLESLGRLAAGMCHEINNPLSFIVTSAELIEQQLEQLGEQIPPRDYDDLTELVHTIGVGASRITRIVRNIKMFARHAERPTERVELDEAITSATRMVQMHLHPHVQLRVDASGAQPVEGRRLEIEQVIINLVENALHALSLQRRPPPYVSVSARLVDGRVCVDVSDNGPGIDESIIDRIFDPFFTTKAVGKGTGLGLAICHNLVGSMGGTIDATNDAEGGATFTIILPCARSPAPDTDQSPAPAPHVPAPLFESVARVLIIDDEPLVLAMLQRVLQPHAVVSTSNVQEALAMCGTEDFDVILCDVMMPGLDGRDFYRMLGQLRPGLESRVVFITGGSFHEGVRAFFDRVPNRTVDKPFDSHELRAIVGEYLQRRRLAEQPPTD